MDGGSLWKKEIRDEVIENPKASVQKLFWLVSSGIMKKRRESIPAAFFLSFYFFKNYKIWIFQPDAAVRQRNRDPFFESGIEIRGRE